MRKLTIVVLVVMAVGVVFAGTSPAQQAPAANTQQAPAATPQKPSAAKTSKAPAAKSPAAAAPPLTTDRDKESYALGMNIGKGLKAQSVDVDTAILARAIKDMLSGATPALTDDEATDALKKLQTDTHARQIKQGQDFLAANKSKEGVVTLPDGLQYKILSEGTGPKPTATDTVVCQYRGTLIDGTEFDSSYKRGQPATFPVNRVIKGWTEALQLMPVGSKWQLFIPPDLAYGERGAPGSPIGPNATLIFEIELMSIRPPIPAPAPAPQKPPTPTPNAVPNANPAPNAAPAPNK